MNSKVIYIPEALNETFIIDLIKDYYEGLTYKQLEERHGLSINQIYNILNKNAIINPVNRLSKEEEKQIVSNYINKVPIKNIALEFQINKSTVFNVLKRNNIKTIGKRKLNNKSEIEVLNKFREGMKIYQIANCFNVSQTTISRILKEHNIEIKKDYDTNWFKEQVSKLTDNQFTVISEYTKIDEPIGLIHEVCNEEVWTTPLSFLLSKKNKNRKGVCPTCSRVVKKTTETFNKELHNKYGEEFILLSEYINNNTRVLLFHQRCGNFLRVLPRHVSAGNSYCSYCNNNRLKTTDKFIEEVFALVKGEYKVLGEYERAQIDIQLKHLTCGYEYFVTPDNFLKGERCPNCCDTKNSSGSKSITNFLMSKNISFIREYKDYGCKDKRPLPFDFAIIKNNEVKAFIEFDGPQHDTPSSLFGGLEAYLEQKIHDNIKNEFAVKNKIKLIRIKYKEKNKIEAILNEELKKIF